MALWLNSTFYAFDYAILNFWHIVAVNAGTILTPIMNFVSLLGKFGWGPIVVCLILIIFKKTRLVGVSALISLLLNFILCNLILKRVIARPRPYLQSELIDWWEFVGSHKESDFSFPSGHVSAMASVMLGIFFTSKNKKYTFTLFIPIIIMAIARNYLMVHYPTDVLGSIIVGIITATASYFITKNIFQKIEKNSGNKFCDFIINSSIVNLFRKIKGDYKK